MPFQHNTSTNGVAFLPRQFIYSLSVFFTQPDRSTHSLSRVQQSNSYAVFETSVFANLDQANIVLCPFFVIARVDNCVFLGHKHVHRAAIGFQ
eukprot:m.86958 g.86958  ORF g.86958 m.86958 type:complete len:93 (-) comp12824_c0_seq1:177-455(-)